MHSTKYANLGGLATCVTAQQIKNAIFPIDRCTFLYTKMAAVTQNYLDVRITCTSSIIEGCHDNHKGVKSSQLK